MSDQLNSRSSCRLLHILRRLEGEQGVNIRTVGGFQFDAVGRLARVEDRLALISGAVIFAPGGNPTEISLTNVTINLNAIDSVGQGGLGGI